MDYDSYYENLTLMPHQSSFVQALKARCHGAASSYILLLLNTIHARCHCGA